MIAGPVQKNLRLILEPSKRACMNDPRAIALQFRAVGVAGLRIFAPARVTRFLGKRRERCMLRGLHFLARPVAASLCEAQPCLSLLGYVYFSHTIISRLSILASPQVRAALIFRA